MKKIIICFGFIALSFVVSAQQQAPTNVPSAKNSDPALPAYIVNGVETPYAKVVKLNTATLESMDVYKGPEAIAKFGAKYKHGVVIVKLKKSKK